MTALAFAPSPFGEQSGPLSAGHRDLAGALQQAKGHDRVRRTGALLGKVPPPSNDGALEVAVTPATGTRWDYLDWLTIASIVAMAAGLIGHAVGGPAGLDWLLPAGMLGFGLIGYRVRAENAAAEDA